MQVELWLAKPSIYLGYRTLPPPFRLQQAVTRMQAAITLEQEATIQGTSAQLMIMAGTATTADMEEIVVVAEAGADQTMAAGIHKKGRTKRVRPIHSKLEYD